MTIEQGLFVISERRISAWIKIYERLREAERAQAAQ
jgi:hypothetical protein